MSGALAGCEAAAARPELPPLEGPGALAAVPLDAPKPEAFEEGQDTARAGTGTLRARQIAAIGPKESGVITSLPLAEGDRVRRGQVLFRLDAAQVELAIRQADAALASAKVQANSTALSFERVKALRERGAASPDTYDQAKAQVDNATSAVAQAEAAIDLATHRLSNMVVTSPIDGVITDKRMNLGESVTLMPPSVVMVVQNVDVLELRARLPESALRDVHVGSTLGAFFPALGLKREVEIARIAPVIDARSRTIEIVADVDNADHRLLAGMLVEISYGHDTKEERAKATP